MKQRLYLPLLVVLLILVGLHACKNPGEFVTDQLVITGESGFDISKIRDDYNDAMAKATTFKITGKDKSEKTNKRRLRWDEAYTVNTPDGERMIVPFSLEEEIFLSDRYGEKTSYSAATFFIVSKKGNKHHFEVATFIPDDPEDPSQVTTNWSGQIVVEDAVGNFIKSYLMKDGQIVGWGADEVNNGRTNILTCKLVEYWSCGWSPAIGYYAPCQYMYSIYKCYYNDPPATEAPGSGVLGVISQTSAFGSSNATGVTSQYYPFVDRLTSITTFSNLTQSQRAGINEILDDIIASQPQKCLMASLYVNLTVYNAKVTWGMDPNGNYYGAYNPVNKTIKFKNGDQITHQVIKEELFHRYQDAYYSGGTAQYVTTGKSNIEFEAKLMRDLMGIQTNGGGVTTQTVGEEHQVEYLMWLNDITDGGTKYPTQWSEVSSQYFHYLELFKQANPLYNYPTVNNLYPNALFSMIISSGCPK